MIPIELSSSIRAEILPEIENDPQKMNSASLNMKLFSVIILIAPTQMGNKKTVLDIKFENFLPSEVSG